VQRGPLKDSAQDNPKEKQFDVSEGSKEGLYNYLWPNFMVNTYPGLGNASTNIIIPIDENRTLAIYEFFLDERIEEEEAKKIVEFIDEVQQEDIIICESVQRGLKSGHYHQGRLILSKENGIQHFQALVNSALGS
jgi:choline monooxygenase